MDIIGFKKWYELNKLSEEDFLYAKDFLKETNQHLMIYHYQDIDRLSIDVLDELIAYWVITNQNTIKHFVILMRYFKMKSKNDLFIHLTKYTGANGVIESILSKLSKVANPIVTKEILDKTEIPVLGTHLLKITHFTKQFVKLLEHKLTEKELRVVLADNHHQIPKQAFFEEKINYEKADTLEDYLKDLHQRKVEELNKFCQTKMVWYEQEITEKVLDYVKSNQEIMSAVLKDDALYITKIPYDTKKYLESDHVMDQAYYLCHCPFAREAIKNYGEFISKQWCYCSGGFTKYPFDVIFDQDLPVELLASALNFDGACRFKIDLKGIDYKK